MLMPRLTAPRVRRMGSLCTWGLLLLAACHFLDSPPMQLAESIPSLPDTETFASSLGVKIPSMHRTVDGVFYSDTKVGTGNQLDSAVSVVIDYNIYLKDGTFIATNQQTVVNMNTFVPGLIEGMLGGLPGASITTGMREGGVRLIVVPSALAYSNVGFKQIPPNATVVYMVTLDQIP